MLGPWIRRLRWEGWDWEKKSRRHREEKDGSGAVWAGQVRTRVCGLLLCVPLSAAWNEMPVSSLAANVCEIPCQIMCPFFFSLINLQEGRMK